MEYILVIMLGIVPYEYDNLRYDDLKTCQYHQRKVFHAFTDISRRNFKVCCKPTKNVSLQSPSSGGEELLCYDHTQMGINLIWK